jgi:cysteinyl-tRNA synthetase
MICAHSSIDHAIGNTPLVEIRRLNPGDGVRIFAKLEYFNPGGSIKDRVAVCMIEEAEKRGELNRGKTILEATSGNTGIGLALVAAARGYHLCLTMSESASEERKRILKALGAELIFTPANLGTDGAIEVAYSLMREHPERYFGTDQFNNEDNVWAHYRGTGEEIWRQTGGGGDDGRRYAGDERNGHGCFPAPQGVQPGHPDDRRGTLPPAPYPGAQKHEGILPAGDFRPEPAG